MKQLHFISRLVIGITFMFSGLVKGIDPLGTAYRLEDYFIVWGTDWLMPFALTLSILLSTMEFVLGLVILLNLKPKVSSWILLGVMVFFTGLTFNDALFNPVPDCGCFGDAIKLTNWQTFYKNLFLMVPTIIILLYRHKTRDAYNSVVSYGSASFAALLFIGLSLYSYMFLPPIDFMNWKVGNKMFTEEALPTSYYLTYRNKESGETKEFLSPNYPYNDSIWMSQWEFVSQRVDDPNSNLGNDLQIIDMEGNDVTDMIIRNPGYQFMLVCWDITKADQEALKEIDNFARQAEEEGHGFAAITSSLASDIDSTRSRLNLTYTFYQADDVTLKTMVRANPGLILLKDGVVMGKWSHKEFVGYDKFTSENMADQ